LKQGQGHQRSLILAAIESAHMGLATLVLPCPGFRDISAVVCQKLLFP